VPGKCTISQVQATQQLRFDARPGFGCLSDRAAEISNHASSVVVGKLGTATHPEELIDSFRDTDG
jgi:bifunctional ADP-heptose synthase (sugar kinase/adenylyltransferase)